MKKFLMLLAAVAVVFIQTAVWAAPIQPKSDEVVVTTTFVPGP